MRPSSTTARRGACEPRDIRSRAPTIVGIGATVGGLIETGTASPDVAAMLRAVTSHSACVAPPTQSGGGARRRALALLVQGEGHATAAGRFREAGSANSVGNGFVLGRRLTYQAVHCGCDSGQVAVQGASEPLNAARLERLTDAGVDGFSTTLVPGLRPSS